MTTHTVGARCSFRGTLLPHQAEAVEWLIATPNALLAQGVGLGRAVEVLALLAQLKETGPESGSGCRVLWLTDTSLMGAAKARNS